LKDLNHQLAGLGTTIFTVMSALAVEHGSINLGQGFPDTDGPDDVMKAAADALMDGRNQYPPMTGVPELRQAVAAANRRFYGLEIDPNSEVVVTSGATEAITASLMALINPGDEVVLIEPLYDTYVPVVRLLGAIPKLVRLSPPNWDLPRAELAAVEVVRGAKVVGAIFHSAVHHSLGGDVQSFADIDVAKTAKPTHRLAVHVTAARTIAATAAAEQIHREALQRGRVIDMTILDVFPDVDIAQRVAGKGQVRGIR